MSIPNNFKGLPSVTDMSNEDYTVWAEANKEKIKGKTSSQIDRLYKNQKFAEKYGLDAFHSLDKNQRDLLYETNEVNNYIKSNYADDERFAEIGNLTLQGKKDLINSDYLTPNDLNNAIVSAEEARKQAAFSPTASFIAPMSIAPNIAQYKGIDTSEDFIKTNQEKTLNQIIEEDKGRKVSDVYDYTKEIKNNYLVSLGKDELSTDDIIHEFDKIASGYSDVISTPDGSVEFNIPGSNYYNAFKDTKWLNNLTFEEKIDLLSTYKALEANYGLADALYYLDSTLQERIAEEQGTFSIEHFTDSWKEIGEKYVDTGQSPSLGEIISTVHHKTGVSVDRVLTTGILPGLWEGILGIAAFTMDDERAANFLQGLDKDGNRLSNIWNIDYISKVQQYNTWDRSDIALADANNGISTHNSVWTKDQENAWFSNKTIADVAEQSKWMLEMALMGGVTSGVGKVLSTTAKTLTKAATIANTSVKVSKAIDTIGDIATGVGRYVKLGADAAPIAAAEAYETYTSTKDANLAIVDSNINKVVEQRVNQALLSEHSKRSIDQMANEAIAQFVKENPDIDPASINIEAFQKRAEQQYAHFLSEQYKEEEKQNFQDQEINAIQSAVDAYDTTFILSNIKTAGMNIGFKRWLYGAPFRKNFNIESPKIKTRIGANGLVEKVPMTFYTKYLEPIYRNTLSEGFDEMLDGLISAYGQGYGEGKFQYYLDNQNEVNALDQFLTGFANGLFSTAEALTEEDIYREGFLGVLSGGTNIVGIGKQGGPIGEKYTVLERINNIVSIPIIHDIVENQRLDAETDARINAVNTVLKKYSPFINDINKILTSVSGYTQAQMLGSDVHTLNFRQKLGNDLMLTLENLSEDEMASSSSIIEDILKTIKKAAKGDISEEEINNFFSMDVNKDLKDKMSREEVKNRIQENAKKLLDIQSKIQSNKQKLSDIPTFRSLHKSIQNDIISNILKYENDDERIASIRKELGLGTEGTRSTPIVGNKEGLKIRRASIEDAIENLEGKIKETEAITKREYKNAEDASEVHNRKSKKLLLQELKNNVKKLKEDLKDLENIKFDENSNEKVYSAEEIKSLDSRNLHYVLDPENAKYFSKEQLKEVEKVKGELENNMHNSSLVWLDVNHYSETLANLKTSSDLLKKFNEALLKHGSDIIPANTTMKSGISDPDTYKYKQEMFNYWNSKLYTIEGKEITDEESILRIFEDSKNNTMVSPSFINAFIESKEFSSEVKSSLEKVQRRAQAIQEYTSIIESLNTPIKSQEFLQQYGISLLFNNTSINNSKEFYDELEQIKNNYGPEYYDLFNEILDKATKIGYQRDATVVRNLEEERRKKKEEEKRIAEEKRTKEEERKKEAQRKLEEKKAEEEKQNAFTVEIPNKEDASVIKATEEIVSEEYEVLEDEVETSVEDQVKEAKVENEEVLSDAAITYLNPVEDSALPDDEDSNPSGENQGNAIYRYDGDSLRNDAKQVKRVGEKENDTMNSLFKWLDDNEIDLQSIIDNELSAIAELDPDVKFMMLTEDQYNDDYSLHNTVFQVVEYTKEIEKIHDTSRGKAIIGSDGKKYLIIGVAGYHQSDAVAATNYINILNTLKRGRGKQNNGYYIHPALHTKIKNIEAGWVVKQSLDDSSSKMRNIDELFNDPKRNPHGLSLHESKWIIQERTKLIPIRIKDTDIVHTPIDVEGNVGAVFLMVPSANGHLIPIKINPKLAKDISETSKLKLKISRLIGMLNSPTFENRFEAKKELAKYLVITKKGEGIYLSKEDNTVTITEKGTVKEVISLSDADATSRLENAILGPNSNFKLNLSFAILSQELQDYIDAEALQTDAAILGTVNASYTVYSVDESGNPIIEEKLTPNSTSINSINTSDYISSQSGNIVYLGQEYTERDSSFYGEDGRLITDVNKIIEIKTAKYLAKHQDASSIRSDSSVSIYVLNSHEENYKDNPKVIRVFKDNGRIEVLGTRAALYEIRKYEEAKKAEQEEKRKQQASFTLEILEEEDKVQDDSKEKSESDLEYDFFSAGEPVKEQKEEDKAQEKEEITIPTKDNSILSDGVAKIITEDRMKTSDFMGSPEFPFTDELVEKFIALGISELQGKDLDNALDRLNIPVFINTNNKEEIDGLIKTILNCRES